MAMKVEFFNTVGTPGTGKSRLAKSLADTLGFCWLDVGAEAKKRGCCNERDEDRDADILDEDLTVDALETEADTGGAIFDYHGVDFFPETWFDAIYVLRTDTAILYDRLAARGYPPKKVEENVQTEIFQVILEEAQESFDASIVHELKSETEQDFEENLKIVTKFVKSWKTHKRQRRH